MSIHTISDIVKQTCLSSNILGLVGEVLSREDAVNDRLLKLPRSILCVRYGVLPSGVRVCGDLASRLGVIMDYVTFITIIHLLTQQSGV